MLNLQSLDLPSIVQHLITVKNLDKQAVYALAQQAKSEKRNLLALLLHQQWLSDTDISQAFTTLYPFPVVDMQSLDIDISLQSLLSPKDILKLQLLPISQYVNHLTVAVADPEQLSLLENIRSMTGLNPNPVIVAYSELQTYFLKLQQAEIATQKKGGGLKVSLKTHQKSYLLDSSRLKQFEQDDRAVSQFVHHMLKHAIENNVSDIHIESYESIFRIRYRMDGVLTVVATPPKKSARQLVSRLKVMARLNSSERRLPQDGNIHFFYNNQQKKIDFRMNTLPTLHGEKVVLRLLDSSSVQMQVDQLGFTEQQKTTYLNALARPEGMILVTGPTGSGKTVTLYTGLSILNRAEKNISTVEDPVEIQLAGINQVNINSKVGLNFSTALKAFLRQDPDIIMLGEIRDMETAEIALKAAQTGHLVLSTLHTNSAPETLTRLVNIGIPAFNIASSVSLVIAQRLVRRLCSCKQAVETHPDLLRYYGFKEAEFATLVIYRAVGCSQCSQGYKGRVGIYQVMPISDVMRQIIMAEGSSLDLAKQAQTENILDLREAALNKVRAGISSMEEVDRVIQD
jgi:type IV pilus assembly protein PilB